MATTTSSSRRAGLGRYSADLPRTTGSAGIQARLSQGAGRR